MVLMIGWAIFFSFPLWQVAGDCYTSGAEHGKGSDHSTAERRRQASSDLERRVRVGTHGGRNGHVGDWR